MGEEEGHGDPVLCRVGISGPNNCAMGHVLHPAIGGNPALGLYPAVMGVSSR